MSNKFEENNKIFSAEGVINRRNFARIRILLKYPFTYFIIHKALLFP